MRIFPQKWAFLMGLLFLTACGTGVNVPDPEIIQPDVPAEVVDFPVAENYVTWLPDGKLLIRTESSGTLYKIDEPISYLLRDGDDLEQRQFPVETHCSAYQYHINGILPDGRLGLVEECNIYDKPYQRPTEEMTYILAYDWHTGEVERLVAQSLPPIGGSWFSWNPDMTRGVQEAGSLLSTLIWLTPERAEPMDILIEDGSRRWSLAENYRVILARESDAREIGRAGSPAWSPDGTQIAFFASPDAVGRNNISRATGEYKLYLMDAALLQPKPVLDGMYFADFLTWSPDGHWLVFIGEREGYCSADTCLWLFSPEREELIQVTSDIMVEPISWSPDGSRLVTARKCGDCQPSNTMLKLSNGDAIPLPACRPSSCYEIVIYDVSTLIAGDP